MVSVSKSQYGLILFEIFFPAFLFCINYNRKTEFRKLCDNVSFSSVFLPSLSMCTHQYLIVWKFKGEMLVTMISAVSVISYKPWAHLSQRAISFNIQMYTHILMPTFPCLHRLDEIHCIRFSSAVSLSVSKLCASNKQGNISP